ncbi:MAG: hypothetical protein M3R10_08590 [Verrucomicrobiota bacterium]|nr:hypothetical protein [Verrucomicrobiota bacterium]
MDEFSYLSVLISIIIGLAVTQILQGFRGLLQSRAHVRIYWPALTWAGLLLVISVQMWWSMFGLRTHVGWTFLGFSVVILQTIFLYMLTGLVLPEVNGDAPVDLRENYFAHHGWLFGLAILTVVTSLLKDLVLTGALPDHTNVAFHIFFIVLATMGALLKNEWFHKSAAVVMVVAFAAYIATLFEHLH